MSVQLYSYFRSSAAYRVRVALYLKNIPFDYIPVHLLNNGGEHLAETYRQLNPMAQIPTLVHNGEAIGQSMAILQYIDQVWPAPSLFPSEPLKKARVIQISEAVNSGIHPIQNLSVLNYLVNDLGLSDDKKKAWAAHWIKVGFDKLERLVMKTAAQYCIGSQLTAADLFVVPQIYNARRFGLDMNNYPTLLKVEENCLQLEAFKKSLPEAQPDFN